jgi:Reverse transcriptase (RNA-dependent DNA polymerase).
MPERTMARDKDACPCFIDWQKAFDHVNWPELMLSIKNAGIDWSERRLISKKYLNRSVQVRLDQEDTRSVKIGGGFREGCCLSPILFHLYSEYLTKEALEWFRSFKIGQMIRTVKYADDLVLLTKEETLLQGVIDRRIEIARCFGMEMNVENLR